MSVDMDQIAVGDIVMADEPGSAYYVRASGRYTFRAGQEFRVTSISAYHLNLKPLGGSSPVVRLPHTAVSYPKRQIGHAPDGGIDSHDPRVAWIFEDAARMADRLGLCVDFDRLCDALGFPGRARTWKIDFGEMDGMEITVKVQARSRREAEERVQNHAPGPLPIRAAKMLTS